MAGSKNAVPRRTYRERQQAGRRLLRFPFLEKKRDWQVRSRRWKARQLLLQHLAEKARCRNEEEFSFRMLKAKQVGGGIDGLGGKTAGETYLLSAAQAAVSSSCSGSTQATSAAAQQKVRRRRQGLAAAKQRHLDMNMRFLQHKQQVLRKRMQKTLANAAATAYSAVAGDSCTTLSAAAAAATRTPHAGDGSESEEGAVSESSSDESEEGPTSTAGLPSSSSSNRGEGTPAATAAAGRHAVQQPECGEVQHQQQQAAAGCRNPAGASSHVGGCDASEEEELSEGDEQQQQLWGCRWLSRAAVSPAADDKCSSSSTEGGGSSDSETSDVASSAFSEDDEEDVGKQQQTGGKGEGKTKSAGSRRRERSSKSSWIEQLQDDCDRVRRVKGILTKLQLQKDLSSKGRRTKVAGEAASSSRAHTAYKWFAERKK